MSKQKLGFVESEELVDTSSAVEERKRDSKLERKNIEAQLRSTGLVTRKPSVFERNLLRNN